MTTFAALLGCLLVLVHEKDMCVGEQAVNSSERSQKFADVQWDASIMKQANAKAITWLMEVLETCRDLAKFMVEPL